jgi:hypothetical protein
MARAIGRLDTIVAQLEKLQHDANQILDAYTDELMCREPRGTSWGDLKYRKIAVPAGSTINHVNALKLIRDRITGRKDPHSQTFIRKTDESI